LQSIVSEAPTVISSPWSTPSLPDADFAAHVLRHAERLADRPALVDAADGRTLRYGELASAARRTAAGLAARGFGPGDALALYSPNVPEFVVAVLGTAMTGGVTTTANPLYTAAELAAQLRDSGARIVVTTPVFADRAAEAARAAGVETVLGFGDLAAGGEPPATEVEPDDVVLLPYSSGTTGLPKGVEITHRAAVAQLAQLESVLTLSPADTVLAVAPMYHCMGLIVVVAHALAQGATVVTMMRFAFEPFLQAMQDHRVTATVVAPPIALGLAGHPAVDGYDLSALRWVGCGAAPLDGRIEETCANRLGCLFGQGYGMSEATATIAVAPIHEPERIVRGTVGALLPGTEARIVAPDAGADLGAGAEGELLIRGPQLMRGYRGRPDATAATIDADGWLHTGDLAAVDANGTIRITDRLKELIKVKGFPVAPAELEGLLCTHPGVADAAVIGVSDDAAGERPKAFVVPRGDAAPDDVMAWVAERVAPTRDCARSRSSTRSRSSRPARSCGASCATAERRGHPCPSSPAAASPISTATSWSSSSACGSTDRGDRTSGYPSSGRWAR
jgi:acyl-CoA synthetase (AMP-forming)/AMP-acid ligase II